MLGTPGRFAGCFKAFLLCFMFGHIAAQTNEISDDLSFTYDVIKDNTVKIVANCTIAKKTNRGLNEILRIRVMKKSGVRWELVAEKKGFEAVRYAPVTDHISGDGVEEFLDITWEYATEVLGVYRCDVTGLDPTSSKFVTKSAPEMAITIVHDNDVLKRLYTENVNKLSALEEDVQQLRDALQSENTSLAEVQRLLDSNVKDLSNLKMSMENQINVISEDINKISNKKAEIPEELIQWPSGRYALLQPAIGCPVDLAFFSGTDRYVKIHTESSSKNKSSGDAHTSAFPASTKVKQVSGRNLMSLKFCEANGVFNKGNWPDGNYCINKMQGLSCPDGFETGNILLDVEDTDTYADYMSHIEITEIRTHMHLHFCCKLHANKNMAMTLPTHYPFMLYRRNGNCQPVEGMSVSLETLSIDTEDIYNSDKGTGKHPDVHFSMNKTDPTVLYICYYTKN